MAEWIGGDKHMSVEAITSNTCFYENLDQQQLVFNELAGFVALSAAAVKDPWHTVFIGYAPQRAGDEYPDMSRPITRYEDVQLTDRTIAKLGKGVGWPRIYNSPEAAAGWVDDIKHVAALAVKIDSTAIYGLNQSDGAGERAPRRIGRHFSRWLATKYDDLAVVVDSIHKQYGDAEGAYFTLPPRAVMRMRLRGMRPPVPPAFILPRNANLVFQKVGEQPMPQAGRLLTSTGLARLLKLADRLIPG